jgi:hypothetical protein
VRLVAEGVIHRGAEPDQFADLRFDELDPPVHRQSPVAAGGVEVEVQPVLPRLHLRHWLEPDRRAQPGRVEQPVVEGRRLAQPRSVERVPGCLGLRRRRRLVAQRLRPEPCQPRRVVRVDRQLPEHHA